MDTRPEDDRETEKSLRKLQDLREAQDAEIKADARRLDKAHIHRLMLGEERSEKTQITVDPKAAGAQEDLSETKPESAHESHTLKPMEGDDPEAKRWNTERQAILDYRDSPSGKGVAGEEISRQMVEPSTKDSSVKEREGAHQDSGKVLTDDREPGVSTHLHHHKDGTTISVKDENTGTIQRYTFETGQGFQKDTKDMDPKEAERRLKTQHTQDNPNPDRDTIPGFHSSRWTKPAKETPKDQEGG